MTALLIDVFALIASLVAMVYSSFFAIKAYMMVKKVKNELYYEIEETISEKAENYLRELAWRFNKPHLPELHFKAWKQGDEEAARKLIEELKELGVEALEFSGGKLLGKLQVLGKGNSAVILKAYKGLEKFATFCDNYNTTGGVDGKGCFICFCINASIYL